MGNSAPIIVPSGASGASAVPAITLKDGAFFVVYGNNSLTLNGYSSGNAVFFAGDGTAGEYLKDLGSVIYSGQSGVDYLKIPVWNSAGTFKVNGASTLQVSGSDSYTNDHSYYQTDYPTAETDISGGGTLWCYNDYEMDGGLLQTTDTKIDKLKVGTSSADGTAYILGGVVNIGATTGSFGQFQIVGSTGGNNPIVDVGSATLFFKVNMNVASNQCDVLTVGNSGGTARINFNYNGGSTTVSISPIGNTTTGHNWQIIFFGSKTGDVTLSPMAGYTKTWNSNNLEINN